MVRVALFGALENRPSVNAVIALARNDVDMEMRYRLTCAFIACVEQVHAVVAAVVDKVTGNLLHGIHHVVQRFAVTVKNMFEVLLRNDEDMSVNVCKRKQLTNMRAAGSDEAIRLVPPRILSLEQALEYINKDELVEVTPEHVRRRKAILDRTIRGRAAKNARK